MSMRAFVAGHRNNGSGAETDGTNAMAARIRRSNATRSGRGCNRTGGAESRRNRDDNGDVAHRRTPTGGRTSVMIVISSGSMRAVPVPADAGEQQHTEAWCGERDQRSRREQRHGEHDRVRVGMRWMR